MRRRGGGGGGMQAFILGILISVLVLALGYNSGG